MWKCKTAIEELKEYIQTKWLAKQIYAYEEIDSTNLEATRIAHGKSPLTETICQSFENGTLVIADTQTAGRGRRGRSWESSSDDNLFFSLLLKPELAPDKASMLTLVMALSVAKGIEEVTNMNCAIKWPNDIVMNRKKICGILTEMELDNRTIHHIVIGVGINVNMVEIPQELSDMATSLAIEYGGGVPKEKLLAAVLRHFEADYETFLAMEDLRGLQKDYENHLINRKQTVRVLDPKHSFEGIAEGISATGELLVRTEDGELKTVYAGEVSVRGLYGYV